MIGLSIEFLAGRYHATPWDHQVNEGVVEWPPSPWRILRALVSASYRMAERPERSQLLALLTPLVEELPEYRLPSYTAAHTRHYMPLVNQSRWTTAKVIDTFYALEGGAADPAQMQVVWPQVEVSAEQRSLLEQLCQQVSYLGRAESWVAMAVLAEGRGLEPNASVALAEVPGVERSQVLAPLTSGELVGFQSALALLPRPKGKKKAWTIPQDLLQVLELDVGEMHRQGWSGIPGARWVSYGVKDVRKPLWDHRPARRGPVPTMARFALAGPVLPQLTAAVSVGERFRQALMAWSRDEDKVPAQVFSGKVDAAESSEGQASAAYRQDQGHAWYLPEVNERGQIDHVVVFSAAGFEEEQALRALGRLQKIWDNQVRGLDLKTVLVALGTVEGEMLRQEDGYGVIGCSRVWRSLTPMVLARHPKAKKLVNKAGEVVGYKMRYVGETGFQLDGPEDQVLRSLGQLPQVLEQMAKWENPGALGGDRVRVAAQDAGGDWLAIAAPSGDWLVRVRCCGAGVSRRFSWPQFQRERFHGEGRRAGGRGFWLELEFREPVGGPIALGYAAHFGLGALVPCAEGK